MSTIVAGVLSIIFGLAMLLSVLAAVLEASEGWREEPTAETGE